MYIHPRLTAFVLKCFGEADGLIYIDGKIMIRAMEWLLTKQKTSGEFIEPGRVIHREMQVPQILQLSVRLCLCLTYVFKWEFFTRNIDIISTENIMCH